MTKTEAIGKIFPEIESLISVLHSSDWSKNPDHRKEVEKRLDDLFAENSLFYELKGMLTEVIGGLPGLVDKEGKVDKESLVLLTNTWTAFKKVKSEVDEKEETIIPAEENLYKFLKEGDSEKKWLENELKKERLKSAKLLRELVSLEAAERDRNDQLRKTEKKEQQKRDEMKDELASIINRLALGKIPTEELNDYRNRLKEIKNLLNVTGAKEKTLKKDIRDDELEKAREALDQIKLEEQRRETKQRITNALAQAKVKKKDLSEERYRNYSRIIDGMNNLSKIIEFEIEISQDITKLGQLLEMIIEALSQGEKAINDGNVEQAEKAKEKSLVFRKLLLKQNYNIFSIDNFHSLVTELEFFISKSRETKNQILQFTK